MKIVAFLNNNKTIQIDCLSLDNKFIMVFFNLLKNQNSILSKTESQQSKHVRIPYTSSTCIQKKITFDGIQNKMKCENRSIFK